MADKGINIYFGASALRTCLGNKAETLAAMEQGAGGLAYNADFGMYVGQSAVQPISGYTRFESLLIEQIGHVLTQTGISLENPDVRLILSTTKGNIGLLADDCEHIPAKAFLYTSAQAVAGHFNSTNPPIVLSNACISGVSAFVVARELLLAGQCKHIIVAGCDVLCEFITAGFASFKSISPMPCRPYDAQRDGLTLGEAAGAILLTTDITLADKARIRLAGGAISNDANHISGPSRTGDGLFYAIRNALHEAGVQAANVGFINAHGTATRYNDEMESKAMALAGINDKPLNSLKGYIGHTLGASGVVETIISAEELKRGLLFGTKGFASSDTPHPLQVSGNAQAIAHGCCVKTASGFGGCNAAIVLDMARPTQAIAPRPARQAKVVAEYNLPASNLPFADFIRQEFKSFGESNMKFYKMSDLSKALYVATERLLAMENMESTEPTRRAIVLANKAASLDADITHQQIINQQLPEGASPAAFVYTLPNVAAGEMCIRHKIQGDNTFFIEDENSGLAEQYARTLIAQNRADTVLCGWCEYLQGHWNVTIKLLKNH